MISCQHGKLFVARKWQPKKHALNACLNAWKTKATFAPDPGLNSSQ